MDFLPIIIENANGNLWTNTIPLVIGGSISCLLGVASSRITYFFDKKKEVTDKQKDFTLNIIRDFKTLFYNAYNYKIVEMRLNRRINLSGQVRKKLATYLNPYTRDLINYVINNNEAINDYYKEKLNIYGAASWEKYICDRYYFESELMAVIPHDVKKIFCTINNLLLPIVKANERDQVDTFVTENFYLDVEKIIDITHGEEDVKSSCYELGSLMGTESELIDHSCEAENCVLYKDILTMLDKLYKEVKLT